MITPSFALTATERVLPRLALDFTTATLDPRVTFTRTTNATNPATYIDSNGVITAATNNQPRFDYDPVTLACKGLLIEESRTNALLNSDSLSTQSVTVTAAARTLSFYGTGQVVLSGVASSTVTGSGAYPTRTTYTFTPTAGSLTLTVTGTVQYAQLELGSFSTSYIPTTTAALTRNADNATMTGTNFSDWYNASEGTLLAEGTGNGTRLVGINDGTNNNRFEIFSSSGSAAVYGVTSGAAVLDLNTGQNMVAQVVKAVLSIEANNVAVSANGVAPLTDTAYAVPAVNRMSIGQWYNNTQHLNGTIKKIAYYPFRLTNSEVQAFSK